MTKLEKFRIKNKFTYEHLTHFLAMHGLKKGRSTIYRWCQGPGSSYWIDHEPRPKSGRLLAKILKCKFEEIYKDYSGVGSTENSSEVCPTNVETRQKS
jgi:hypothetical protein